MAQETALYRDDVEQLRRRFAEWRGTHAVRSRLPEELWAAAAELGQRHGADATARALDVDKELTSGRRVAARWQATAGVDGHWDQRTGRPDSCVCEHADMLQITPLMRILVAVEAVDFR